MEVVKSHIVLDFEIEKEEIPGKQLLGKPAYRPVNVYRKLSLDGKVIFEKKEPVEDYVNEKSIMSDFISTLTPMDIKLLEKGECPNYIP